MDLAGIKAVARDWLDDEVEPYLYPDDRLDLYANEAHVQACIRERALFDSVDASLCTIQLVEGQSLYPLHPAIIVVRRAEFRSSQPGVFPWTLRRTTFEQLDHEDRGWTMRRGSPEAMVQDLQRRQLRLSHIPGANPGSLHLTVWRKPLDDEALDTDSDEPLVSDLHHIDLAHWICYRAFLKKDGEANDPRRAAEHLAQFETAFGPAPTAAQLRALATDEAGEVRAYWY